MKISIITVCKNAEKTIEKTINSVISQTYKNIEYIIIDGKSSDGTISIINKYINKISYFISEPDHGIYNAMNKGILKANGDYCFFINSDDYLYDNRILEKIFCIDYDYDIIYGDILVNYGYNRRLKLKKSPKKTSYYFLYNNSISHPAQFIKRSLFIRHGLYDETYKLAGDYEFQIRVIVKYNAKTCYLPYIISVYNHIGLSSQPGNFQIAYNESKKIQKKYFSEKLLELLEEHDKLEKLLIIRLLKKIKIKMYLKKIKTTFLQIITKFLKLNKKKF